MISIGRPVASLTIRSDLPRRFSSRARDLADHTIPCSVCQRHTQNTVGVGGWRHLDTLQAVKSKPLVIGRIAHQYHPVPSLLACQSKAFADQTAAQALALSGWVH